MDNRDEPGSLILYRKIYSPVVKLNSRQATSPKRQWRRRLTPTRTVLSDRWWRIDRFEYQIRKVRKFFEINKHEFTQKIFFDVDCGKFNLLKSQWRKPIASEGWRRGITLYESSLPITSAYSSMRSVKTLSSIIWTRRWAVPRHRGTPWATNDRRQGVVASPPTNFSSIFVVPFKFQYGLKPVS